MNRILLYTEKNYQGQSFKLRVGEYNLRRLVSIIPRETLYKGIKSIKVPGGFMVQFFKFDNFRTLTKQFAMNTKDNSRGSSFFPIPMSIKVLKVDFNKAFGLDKVARDEDNKKVYTGCGKNYQGGEACHISCGKDKCKIGYCEDEGFCRSDNAIKKPILRKTADRNCMPTVKGYDIIKKQGKNLNEIVDFCNLQLNSSKCIGSKYEGEDNVCSYGNTKCRPTKEGYRMANLKGVDKSVMDAYCSNYNANAGECNLSEWEGMQNVCGYEQKLFEDKELQCIEVEKEDNVNSQFVAAKIYNDDGIICGGWGGKECHWYSNIDECESQRKNADLTENGIRFKKENCTGWCNKVKDDLKRGTIGKKLTCINMHKDDFGRNTYIAAKLIKDGVYCGGYKDQKTQEHKCHIYKNKEECNKRRNDNNVLTEGLELKNESCTGWCRKAKEKLTTHGDNLLKIDEYKKQILHVIQNSKIFKGNCNNYLAKGTCNKNATCAWVGDMTNGKCDFKEKDSGTGWCSFKPEKQNLSIDEKNKCKTFHNQNTCENDENSINCKWFTDFESGWCEPTKEAKNPDSCRIIKYKKECKNKESSGCNWIQYGAAKRPGEYCKDQNDKNINRNCNSNNCQTRCCKPDTDPNCVNCDEKGDCDQCAIGFKSNKLPDGKFVCEIDNSNCEYQKMFKYDDTTNRPQSKSQQQSPQNTNNVNMPTNGTQSISPFVGSRVYDNESKKNIREHFFFLSNKGLGDKCRYTTDCKNSSIEKDNVLCCKSDDKNIKHKVCTENPDKLYECKLDDDKFMNNYKCKFYKKLCKSGLMYKKNDNCYCSSQKRHIVKKKLYNFFQKYDKVKLNENELTKIMDNYKIKGKKDVFDEHKIILYLFKKYRYYDKYQKKIVIPTENDIDPDLIDVQKEYHKLTTTTNSITKKPTVETFENRNYETIVDNLKKQFNKKKIKDPKVFCIPKGDNKPKVLETFKSKKSKKSVTKKSKKSKKESFKGKLDIHKYCDGLNVKECEKSRTCKVWRVPKPTEPPVVEPEPTEPPVTTPDPRIKEMEEAERLRKKLLNKKVSELLAWKESELKKKMKPTKKLDSEILFKDWSGEDNVRSLFVSILRNPFKAFNLFTVKNKAAEQMFVSSMLLYMVLKVVSMFIAGYFAWHCSYQDVTVLKMFNAMISAVFSEIYLLYIWVRNTFFGKLC